MNILFYACAALTIFQIYANTAPEFVVLVTSYNNEKWVKRDLDSIVCQRSSRPFEIICVNDGSSDRTGELMDAYAKEHVSPAYSLKIIHNEYRVGSALENIYNTIHNHIADNKIVVCIDGDDTLSFSGVLKRLEKEYENPEVWMTYGRFVVYPAGEFWSACGGYPEEVIQKHSFRKHHNVPSHLKTFRSALFKKIKREDLLDPTGQIYRKAWDMAMLFPMLEICAPLYPGAPNHSVFIDDIILYVYNYDNPIGDSRTNAGRAEQIELDRYIRSLPPYEPLEHL